MTDKPGYRANLRYEALAGIANGRPICRCCGEKDHRFLTFDHIDGGGQADRRAAKGAPVVKIVRSHRHKTGQWPTEKFQILCSNCNAAKNSYGECPHQNRNTMTDTSLAMLGSYSRVLLAIFSAAVLGKILDAGDIFSISLDDWKTYVAAGVAATIPVLLRWLNPYDPAYGLVVSSEDGEIEIH